MLKIRIDGDPHELGTNWDEVPFGKYRGLVDSAGTLHTLAILIDKPIDYVKGKRIEGLEILIRNLAFLRSTPKIDEIPVKLGTYNIPKDVTFETIEQFEDTRIAINQSKADGLTLGERTKFLAKIAAIYIQPAWDGGPYDSQRADVVADKLDAFPCLEVLGLGNFFQAKCIHLSSDLSMNYLRKNIPMKKKRPGFLKLVASLDFTRLWTRSRDTSSNVIKAS